MTMKGNDNEGMIIWTTYNEEMIDPREVLFATLMVPLSDGYSHIDLLDELRPRLRPEPVLHGLLRVLCVVVDDTDVVAAGAAIQLRHHAPRVVLQRRETKGSTHDKWNDCTPTPNIPNSVVYFMP